MYNWFYRNDKREHFLGVLKYPTQKTLFYFFDYIYLYHEIAFGQNKIQIFEQKIIGFDCLRLLLDALELPLSFAYPFFAFLFGYFVKLEHYNIHLAQDKTKIMYPLGIENYSNYFQVPTWYNGVAAYWNTV